MAKHKNIKNSEVAAVFAAYPKEVKPKLIKEPKPGRWTYDLGQNMVGVVRLKIYSYAHCLP